MTSLLNNCFDSNAQEYLGENKNSQKDHISVYFQIFEHDLSHSFNKVLEKMLHLYFAYKNGRKHDCNSFTFDLMLRIQKAQDITEQYVQRLQNNSLS